MAKDIHEALLEIQTEGIEGVTKDSKNPHFKNTYISLGKLLEVVLPVLSGKGIILRQTPMANLNGDPALWTLMHHAESNTYIEGTTPLMLEKSNPQGLGSAITYARRYALMSMLNLVADEDDDGAAASPVREVVNAVSADNKPLF